VREGESKRRAIYRVAVIGGILITAAIITLYTPWLRLFDLREIVVRGNCHISTEEIKYLAGFRMGGSLLRTPVSRALKALLGLPWVKAASIQRVYPHRLEIVIHERTPIAVVSDPAKGDSLLIIGEGGVIVKQISNEAPPTLLARGVNLTGDAPGARLVDERVVVALECIYRKGLSEGPFHLIDFSDPSSVTLHGEDELKVVLGPVDGIGPRIDALAALLLTIDLPEYRSIDLRFGGEAILVPRKVVNR